MTNFNKKIKKRSNIVLKLLLFSSFSTYLQYWFFVVTVFSLHKQPGSGFEIAKAYQVQSIRLTVCFIRDS